MSKSSSESSPSIAVSITETLVGPVKRSFEYGSENSGTFATLTVDGEDRALLFFESKSSNKPLGILDSPQNAKLSGNSTNFVLNDKWRILNCPELYSEFSGAKENATWFSRFLNSSSSTIEIKHGGEIPPDSVLNRLVEKDLARTRSDHKPELKRILIHFSLKNPRFSYKQGMNEIVARLYEMCRFDIAETYCVFEFLILNDTLGLHDAFSEQEHPDLRLLKRFRLISTNYLSFIDFELAELFKRVNLNPSTFLLRYQRLLLSREVPNDRLEFLWNEMFTDLERRDWKIPFVLDAYCTAALAERSEEILQHSNTGDSMDILRIIGKGTLSVERVINRARKLLNDYNKDHLQKHEQGLFAAEEESLQYLKIFPKNRTSKTNVIKGLGASEYVELKGGKVQQ